MIGGFAGVVNGVVAVLVAALGGSRVSLVVVGSWRPVTVRTPTRRASSRGRLRSAGADDRVCAASQKH